MQKGFTYVSLFSGIGGFEQALNSLGGTCLMASEFDKFAEQAYQAIYGHATKGDVTKIDAKDVPDHDILVGGFPCQSFSQAGLRKGFEDTRGTLFYDIVRIASEKKPKALLLENVKGLVNHKSEVGFEGALETQLKRGGVFWEQDGSFPTNKSSIVRRNVESYLQRKSQEISDFQISKYTTSLTGIQTLNSEKMGIYLNYGVMKRLKYLKTQLLLIMRRLSSSQIGLIQQSGCNVEDLVSNLNRLNLEESSLIEDINLLELMVDTKKEVGLLWKSISEEKSPKERSSTISTESNQTIELKTFIYALTELNIILSIIKHSCSSGNSLIKDLSSSTKRMESMYTINTLDVMFETLIDTGYVVDFDVLNSKYFGVPQNRERIFIVAIREDLIEQERWSDEVTKGQTVVPRGKRRISEYDWAKTFNFDYPKQAEVTTRLRGILEDEVDEKYYLSDDMTAKLVVQLEEKEIADVTDSPNMLGLCDIKGNDAIRRVYGTDGVSSTLTTMQGGHQEPKIAVMGNVGRTGHNNMNVHNAEGLSPTITARDYKGAKIIAEEQADKPRYRLRKLTPLECFRLQAFPDSVHQTLVDDGISDSQRYKMAGNAVTVTVVEEIAKRLLPLLGKRIT